MKVDFDYIGNMDEPNSYLFISKNATTDRKSLNFPLLTCINETSAGYCKNQDCWEADCGNDAQFSARYVCMNCIVIDLWLKNRVFCTRQCWACSQIGQTTTIINAHGTSTTLTIIETFFYLYNQSHVVQIYCVVIRCTSNVIDIHLNITLPTRFCSIYNMASLSCIDIFHHMYIRLYISRWLLGLSGIVIPKYAVGNNWIFFISFNLAMDCLDFHRITPVLVFLFRY